MKSILAFFIAVVAAQDAAATNSTEEESTKIIEEGVHVREGTLFDYIGKECNFFRNSGTMVAPWPDNCKVF